MIFKRIMMKFDDFCIKLDEQIVLLMKNSQISPNTKTHQKTYTNPLKKSKRYINQKNNLIIAEYIKWEFQFLE